MSPEYSTVWMWVAVNASFLAVLFFGLWRIERKYANKLERVIEDEDSEA